MPEAPEPAASGPAAPPPGAAPAGGSPRARLRLSPRSVVLAVVLLGLTLALLRLLAAAGRVIGWVLVAVALAGLLHPAVELLQRRTPRGVALAVVAAAALALTGLVVYAVVDDVAAGVRELQREVPRAAREIERSETVGEAAREVGLAERAEAFVEELPERLRGGSVQDALRSAATRGIAFLATGVLTLFFLIHGGELVAAALRQIPGEERRERIRRRAEQAYRRAWRYAAGSLAMAVTSGVLAYVSAVVVEVPGAAALAVWMAVFDLVPLLGVVIGALPLLLLTLTGSVLDTVLVAVVLLGWQLAEALLVQTRVEQRSLHLGPFLTVAVGMVGLELYGIGGALVSLAVAVVVVAVLDQLGPDEPLHPAATALAPERS